ncbi:MAG: MFS transporter [SAR202 cluster bacterium]|nr:MFS transporter [SAR202 cluster bacterium]
MHYPAYRRYWLGAMASVSGFQILRFAELWLVHELSESPLALGWVGLANAAPAIGLNLFGGVLADKVDKRKLIMTAQTIGAILVFTLAALTLTEAVEVWHIILIAFGAGVIEAFYGPAHESFYPHLVDRRAIVSAVALDSSLWQGNRIIAPAIAGLIIATAGTSAAFLVAGIGFLAKVIVVSTLKPPPIPRTHGTSAVRDLLDGFRFLRQNSIIAFLIGMTFFNSFFGLAYVMLLPIFTVDVLGVDADRQGLLMAVGGIGALKTTLWLSSRTSNSGKGMLLIGGAITYGLALAAFALTSEFIGNYWLALALIYVMGVTNSAYMISVMSSLQLLIPDHMRGRVMGLFGMTWSFMPLGGTQAGAVANFIGAPFAIAIGGFLVTAFAIGPALVNRQVRNLGALLQRGEQSSVTSD